MGKGAAEIKLQFGQQALNAVAQDVARCAGGSLHPGHPPGAAARRRPATLDPEAVPTCTICVPASVDYERHGNDRGCPSVRAANPCRRCGATGEQVHGPLCARISSKNHDAAQGRGVSRQGALDGALHRRCCWRKWHRLTAWPPSLRRRRSQQIPGEVSAPVSVSRTRCSDGERGSPRHGHRRARSRGASA